MRRTTSLTAAGLLGLALAAVPATGATAAGETCHGVPATIVGTPSATLTGTEGADVIVTNGANGVEALGGDDLVCVTGATDPDGTRGVDVDAGPGDDVVDGTAAPGWGVQGNLGTGADTFTGGAAGDYVSAGAYDASYRHVDDERDVLSGGGGRDSFTTGQDGRFNTDVVDLGSGDDYVSYGGTPAAGGTVTGGAGGDDTLGLMTSARTLGLDNRAGVLTQDGAQVLSWTGVESFSIWSARDARVDVSFTGTDADERLALSTGSGVVTASMGGGDDQVLTGARLLTGSTVDAATGRDSLYVVDRDASVALDLAKQRLGATDSATGTQVATVRGVEDAEAHARTVVLKGTGARNVLGLTACRGTVVGRGGADQMGRVYEGWGETRPECREERYTLDGGAGADTLEGYSGRDRLNGGTGNDVMLGKGDADRLVGGPGRDRADGGQGRPDTCRAEVRTRSCER